VLQIEKFVMHIIRTPELWERLSEQEQGYAQRYVDALSKHMKNCVLDKLETAYCSMVKQAESSEGDDMSIHSIKVRLLYECTAVFWFRLFP
jgi:GINS complex subunit 4